MKPSRIMLTILSTSIVYIVLMTVNIVFTVKRSGGAWDEPNACFVEIAQAAKTHLIYLPLNQNVQRGNNLYLEHLLHSERWGRDQVLNVRKKHPWRINIELMVCNAQICKESFNCWHHCWFPNLLIRSNINFILNTWLNWRRSSSFCFMTPQTQTKAHGCGVGLTAWTLQCNTNT